MDGDGKFQVVQRCSELCKFLSEVAVFVSGHTVCPSGVSFVEVAICDGRIVCIEEWRGLLNAMQEKGVLGVDAQSCQDDHDGQEDCLGDQTCHTCFQIDFLLLITDNSGNP